MTPDQQAKLIASLIFYGLIAAVTIAVAYRLNQM